MPGDRAFALLLAAAVGLGACDGCERKPRTKKAVAAAVHCATDQDCDDENPCTREECHAGECAVAPAPEATSCDDGNVCNGISSCDGKGTCRTAPAPAVDDGNACTIDACDPARGVTHQPLPVDDADECTADSCDPKTGQILHDSVKLDDGDDCTFDSCDPKRGVQHRRPESFHTCAPGCGEGFHAASKRRNKECGSDEALQTFCAPSCGKSFYSCDSSCPPGYEKGAETVTDVCGARTSVSIFCSKG